MIKRIMAALAAALLCLPLSSCKKAESVSVTVMSQNLRVESASDGADNDILLRSERFWGLIEKYQPDVVGMQEYTTGWDYMMWDYLEDSDYEIVFQYRAENDSEATPIMYNRNKVELVSSEFFWLSETPEVESPSWDDNQGRRCRIATECVFKEKETGIRFVHINTHFGLTATSQDGAGQLIHDRVQERWGDMPVFVTGDFNSREGSQAYDNITQDGLLSNSAYLAEETGTVCGTFTGYKDTPGAVIDFVFVTQKVQPQYYTVLTDKPDGKFVSDHFGLLTKNVVMR